MHIRLNVKRQIGLVVEEELTWRTMGKYSSHDKRFPDALKSWQSKLYNHACQWRDIPGQGKLLKSGRLWGDRCPEHVVGHDQNSTVCIRKSRLTSYVSRTFMYSRAVQPSEVWTNPDWKAEQQASSVTCGVSQIPSCFASSCNL